MGVPQRTRDNHFVPQASLRRWADADNKVWCYRLLVPDVRVPPWRRHSVRSIAYHEHLYTSALAGEETDRFEQWIGQEFEGPGQEAIEKAVSERRLTRQDWMALVRYAAAQDVRTPARYLEHTRRWNVEVPQLLDETLTHSLAEWEAADTATRDALRSKPRDPETADFPVLVTVTRDPTRGGGRLRVETIVGRQMWLASMRLWLTRSIGALYEHRWSIMRAPDGVTWITSDDPVIRLNYMSEREYNFGGGWGSAGSEFIFPLSPKHLLYTQIGKRHDSRITASPQLAERLQRFIAEHAHRWIYAAAPSSYVEKVRPRQVDRAQFVDELRGWAEWHQNQMAAEKDLAPPAA
jgi:hypothetical protein